MVPHNAKDFESNYLIRYRHPEEKLKNRLLILDSDLISLLIYKKYTQSLINFELATKASEHETLLTLDKTSPKAPFDIFIFDIKANSGDHLEYMKKIIRLRKLSFPSMKIICFIGIMSSSEKKELIAAGVNELVQRPITKAVFRRILYEYSR